MSDVSLGSIIQGTTLLGFTGSRGDLGYAGSLGYTGSAGAGFTGSQGIQGNIGYTGSAGVDGTIGVDGYTGSQGIQGNIGYTGSGASINPWTLVTANYTAVDGDRIIANSATGSFNITLPAVPSTGHSVQITDGADLTANAVTVLRNGETIENVADDILLDVTNTTVEFIYSGNTWQIISTAGSRGPVGYTGSAGEGGGGGVSAGKTILLSMFF